MKGYLVFFTLILWVFFIINIVFCVKTGRRYKKLGMKGAAKRITLSWVIAGCGTTVGIILATAVNSRNPMTTVAVIYITAYISCIIATMYIYTPDGASED